VDVSRERLEAAGGVTLTDRELEVLQLKARRRTNAEIAEQLVISLATVKWHVSQIYGKLGVGNRAEAVKAARQFGVLDQRRELKQSPSTMCPSH
jgi:ATP/maltotriose-dependent transcriptional regulator MalT